MAFYQTPGTDFHDLNLDWVLNQVKQLTIEWASTREDWEQLRTDTTAFMTAIETDWRSYKTTIDNFFATLQLQDEVDAKIDEMVESGEFAQIINATVQSVTTSTTTAWLVENISQETGYIVDASLSIAGAAADAKATGDITKLNSTRIQAFEKTLYYSDVISVSSGTGNKAWVNREGVIAYCKPGC